MEDLNQDYICSIGEYSCKRNLTINMFDKHLLDRDVPGDDSTSSFNKKDIRLVKILIIGFASLATIFLIYTVCCFVTHKQIIFDKFCIRNETKSNTYIVEDSPVLIRSVSVKSNYSQNIQIRGDGSEKPFIQPLTCIKDEKTQRN